MDLSDKSLTQRTTAGLLPGATLGENARSRNAGERLTTGRQRQQEVACRATGPLRAVVRSAGALLRTPARCRRCRHALAALGVAGTRPAAGRAGMAPLRKARGLRRDGALAAVPAGVRGGAAEPGAHRAVAGAGVGGGPAARRGVARRVAQLRGRERGGSSRSGSVPAGHRALAGDAGPGGRGAAGAADLREGGRDRPRSRRRGRGSRPRHDPAHVSRRERGLQGDLRGRAPGRPLPLRADHAAHLRAGPLYPEGCPDVRRSRGLP
jgi:hypothetical protein